MLTNDTLWYFKTENMDEQPAAPGIPLDSEGSQGRLCDATVNVHTSFLHPSGLIDIARPKCFKSRPWGTTGHM